MKRGEGTGKNIVKIYYEWVQIPQDECDHYVYEKNANKINFLKTHLRLKMHVIIQLAYATAEFSLADLKSAQNSDISLQ